jgi:hypothetical protein
LDCANLFTLRNTLPVDSSIVIAPADLGRILSHPMGEGRKEESSAIPLKIRAPGFAGHYSA